MFAYFEDLNCFDVPKFVSWQTVNSNVSIRVELIIAMSGRKELNTFDSCLNWPSSRSTHISQSGLMWWVIQSARIFRIPSCRFLYRSRADAQFDRTCLLVWLKFRHKEQSGSCDLPHLTRFAAVGSCWMIAFLAKLYRGVASLSSTFVHLEISDPHRCSLIDAMILPCTVYIQRDNVFEADSGVFVIHLAKRFRSTWVDSKVWYQDKRPENNGPLAHCGLQAATMG